MKRALAVLAAVALAIAGGIVGVAQEEPLVLDEQLVLEDPLGGFFFFEARPWADAGGTWGDAWVNIGIGYQSHTWFAALSIGYPSELAIMSYWFVQGGVVVPVTDRTSFVVGGTISTFMYGFQPEELYMSPFLGFNWAWRPNIIAFLYINLPLYVYEELPLLGVYPSFGIRVSPW